MADKQVKVEVIDEVKEEVKQEVVEEVKDEVKQEVQTVEPKKGLFARGWAFAKNNWLPILAGGVVVGTGVGSYMYGKQVGKNSFAEYEADDDDDDDYDSDDDNNDSNDTYTSSSNDGNN